MIRPAANEPIRLGKPTSSRDYSGHFIAPVCATCGQEIDKTGEQWFHVSHIADAGFARLALGSPKELTP